MSNTTVLKNNVFSRLSAINAASIKAAKGWDKKATSIPIPLYKEVIKNAQWQKKGLKNIVKRDYIDNYNKMINLLFDTAKNSAFKFGVDSVPLEFVDMTIKQVKEAFIIGMKK